MDGPQVERAPRLVPDHVAHFDEQTCQRAVRNEGSRPELLVDLTLRYGFRAVFEEELEELERFGLDVDRLTAEEQLARLRVEQAFAETDPHPPPFESESCIIPRSRPPLLQRKDSDFQGFSQRLGLLRNRSVGFE